jgi:uncharacterized protein YcfJ
MSKLVKSVIGAAGLAVATHAAAQVTFYEGEGFRGRAFATSSTIDNFASTGFNDRASSVVVDRGRWEVCEHAHFEGRCVVLRRGSYDSLAAIGINNQISSVRPVARAARLETEVPPPMAAPSYEYRQRPGERLFAADVTSVRAVVGPPEQRCWVERQQVVEDGPGGANVPGAIIGAVIGGVLGHQIGGGRGRDVATAGGAVAGAAIGANAGRGPGQVYSQDIQRCTSVSGSAQPDYWDVTYNFRGQEHRVQMSAPPGPTIAVNARGEPRG